MLYHVSRNGQNYGPYTLEDLRRYVTSGNVLPTDLAKSDDMAEWVPVSQVLNIIAPAVGAVAPPDAPYGGAAPYAIAAPYPTAGLAYPDPPNLHWALVLLIGVFTCGLFLTVWAFVQAAWMRKVNPRSNALFFYIAGTVVGYGGGIARFFLVLSSGLEHMYLTLGFTIWLITLVLFLFGIFDLRRSMEEHFNGPEPIGLSLSAVMTFFFSTFYFQYHMTRINEFKHMARYRGSAI